MNFTLNKSLYRKCGPDYAEGEIGGSVLSDLYEGDHFEDLPDPYDFTLYLSHEKYIDDYDGPVHVVAVFREGRSDQRTFTLDHKQFMRDIDAEYLGVDGDGYPEDWVEVKSV